MWFDPQYHAGLSVNIACEWAHPYIIIWLTSNDGIKWTTDCSSWLPARDLTIKGSTKLRLTYHPCHIWWVLPPLLHHKPSQGWLSCLHWPSQWQGCESVGVDSVPWAFEPVSHLDLICVSHGVAILSHVNWPTQRRCTSCICHDWYCARIQDQVVWLRGWWKENAH